MKIAKNQNRNIPEMDKNSFDTILFKRKIAAFLRMNKPTLANEFAGQMALFFPQNARQIFMMTHALIQSRMRVLKIQTLVQSMIESRFSTTDQIETGKYKIVEGAGAPWAKIKS
ncbi:hypothetical protein K9M59_02820 [Candidatus Gracilibacteria bacterium]|nr:hypothetical protein [Candidatus Gracilibacteria bacterium]MCF7819264.1 hypothetical protein [Candidatus Gracilibacteria bacterium]